MIEKVKPITTTFVNSRCCKHRVSMQMQFTDPRSVIFSHSFEVVHQFEHGRIAYPNFVRILSFKNANYFSIFKLNISKIESILHTIVSIVNPAAFKSPPTSLIAANGDTWAANPCRSTVQLV